MLTLIGAPIIASSALVSGKISSGPWPPTSPLGVAPDATAGAGAAARGVAAAAAAATAGAAAGARSAPVTGPATGVAGTGAGAMTGCGGCGRQAERASCRMGASAGASFWHCSQGSRT